MDKILLFLAICVSICVACKSDSKAEPIEHSEESVAVDSSIYELRTYYAAEGRLDDLVSRFRDHTVDLFNKHGMENVGYWTNTSVNNELIYLLKHKSITAKDQSWSAFVNDPAWIEARDASEANGKLIDSIHSQLLVLTDYSNELTYPVLTENVFELRTYYTHEGKLEKLHDRFAKHTMGIFDRLDMKNVGYWHLHPSEAGADHTMVYIIRHSSADQVKANWATFIEDPEWKKVYAEYTADGKLVESIDSKVLAPTDFSAIQ